MKKRKNKVKTKKKIKYQSGGFEKEDREYIDKMEQELYKNIKYLQGKIKDLENIPESDIEQRVKKLEEVEEPFDMIDTTCRIQSDINADRLDEYRTRIEELEKLILPKKITKSEFDKARESLNYLKSKRKVTTSEFNEARRSLKKGKKKRKKTNKRKK